MARRNDGGDAFPRPATAFATPNGMAGDDGAAGMSLRDYFASHAMNGVLSGMRPAAFTATGSELYEKIARMSFYVADAMLAERAK